MTSPENPTAFDRFAWSIANFVSRAPFLPSALLWSSSGRRLPSEGDKDQDLAMDVKDLREAVGLGE